MFWKADKFEVEGVLSCFLCQGLGAGIAFGNSHLLVKQRSLMIISTC